MKTLYSIFTTAVLALASVAGVAQDYPNEYLGLPGDNLNLYAVMNLFQESETLEGFERSLNDNDEVINNLDLNSDNLIDYIAVSDYKEGDVHTIVLRTALSRNEQQDIAVFFVEKLNNGAVQIQLVGDEALYGPNYIVEPIYAETANPGYTGAVHRGNTNVVSTSYYDIGAWPVIRFIYAPRYRVWRSSWYWGYYPSYWRPSRPHYWHYYYGYHNQWHNHYYSHYRQWDHYRCNNYHNYYHSHVRVHSPTVVVNINQNRYRSTYSRPDQHRAGAELYTRTASRRSRSSVSANRNSTNTVRTRPASSSRSTTVQRSNSSRSTPSVQRSSSSSRNSSGAVSRSSSSRSTPSVQRSSSSRSTPSIQRSSSRSTTVKRSQPVQSRSTVKRSQPVQSRSTTVKRSQPVQSRSTVKRSNSGSSSRSSSGTVSRSSSSRSTPSVQRSSSSRSTPSVQRSSSKKSTSSVQRSQPSKSKSSASRSSSSQKSSSSSRSSNSSRSSSRR